MITAKKIKSLVFTINELKKISERRNYSKVTEECNSVLNEIEKLNGNLTDKIFSETEHKFFSVIDNLKFIVEIEKRFILFPLPDIKKEAYEIGKKYMENFLEWMNLERTDENLIHYSPEKLMGILDDDSYRLEEMQELLEKIR